LILRIGWKSQNGHDPVELRRARFRAVLLAAQKTRYYSPLLAAAALETREDISALYSIEEGLARLPRTEPSSLRNHPRAFQNPAAPKPALQKLFCPLPAASRTAVLMAGFKQGGGVRVFPELHRRTLARFRPNAIAGPISVLRRLAEAAEDRGAWVPHLTHSTIAFNIPQRSFLSQEAREISWRVFQVPVFGQFLGLARELLAWECEAHEGLHVETDNAIFETDAGEREPELLVTSLINLRRPLLRLATGLTATMEHSVCGCGLTGPRLVGLRRRVLNSAAPLSRAAAASSFAAD
jgi:hypothetical protein